MKLVIIGNGFDLHHGLKTSFNDFRSYLLNVSRDEELVNYIDTIIKSNDKNINLNNINLAWNNIEKIINREFTLRKNNIEEIEKLENIIEDFIEKFYEYLIMEENKSSIIQNNTISRKINAADALLVFNYTKTYEKYITNNSIDTFHIHGCLENSNLPLIGYYHRNIKPSNSSDYYLKYSGNVFHKPSMAYKQNAKDLENEIQIFTQKYSKKIDEVVVIGYSFGESDSHIYSILNDLLIRQEHTPNMKYDEAEKIPKIDFNIFSYDDNESNNLITRITANFKMMHQRNMKVNKFGNGIKKVSEELIRFNLLNY